MPHRPDALSRRNFLMASASGVLLTACASRTSGAADISLTPTLPSLLAAQAVPIRKIAADDPGVKALAKRLSAVRVAGLGQATQGSHQDAQLNSVLLQVMVESHGLRTILLATSRDGGAALDRFASGKPTGLLAAEAVKEAPVPALFKTEVTADLLTWLRGWNAVNIDEPVRLAGIDCRDSSADAAAALAALASVDSGTADALAASLAPILTPQAKALDQVQMVKQLTSAQLAEAESSCQLLEGELARAGLKDAAFAARLAWQGLSAFAHETSDSDPSTAGPGYHSLRDGFLAQNTLHMLANGRGVFLAQSMQVLGGRPGGAEDDVPWGAVMRDALGPDYAALVQDFSKANFLTLTGKPEAPFTTMARTARPGTFNGLLTAASPRTAWFDISALSDNALVKDWRAAPIGFDWYGPQTPAQAGELDIPSASPGRMIDVAVIHPQLTPARML